MLYSGKIWFMNNSFIRNVQYIDDDVSVAIYVFEVLFFIRVLFFVYEFPYWKSNTSTTRFIEYFSRHVKSIQKNYYQT